VYQYSQAAGVEQIDGKWYTKHILGPVFTDTTVDGVTTTAAENEAAYKAAKDAEQAKSVRTSRSEKLKDSDWTQVADAPVDQAAWAAYRQALRDITSQAGFPWTIEWPEQP
jgi:multidrug resistance efflux pump